MLPLHPSVRQHCSDIVIAPCSQNRSNVLQVIEIFNRIEREEKEKVLTLFGKESPVSSYFREITGSRYEEVAYEHEAEKILIKGEEGPPLDVEKLSGGARDQLYLSIRLALGEKLLKGNSGFFIMDDPFIKADRGRLEKQMDILRSMTTRGWQVIYLTAKDEVRDLLMKDIEQGKISYLTL